MTELMNFLGLCLLVVFAIAIGLLWLRNLIFLVRTPFTQNFIMSVLRTIGVFIPLLGIIMGLIRP